MNQMRICSIAVLMLVACREQPTSPKTGLEASTRVTPAVFRVGEIVTVEVVVINRASQPRTIVTNGCPDPFEVTTSDGTVVAPGERICSLDLQYKVLAAGEQFVFTQPWSGDAMRGGFGAPARALTPGTYLVRGLVYGLGTNAETASVATIRIIP